MKKGDFFTYLYERNDLRTIDVELARVLNGMFPTEPVVVFATVAVLSAQTQDGHACLTVRDVLEQLLVWCSQDEYEELRLDEEQLLGVLNKSSVVGKEEENAPVIIDRWGFIHLGRFWRIQSEIANWLVKKLAQNLGLKMPQLQSVLDDDSLSLPLERNFLVITGGPGSGKTFTVTKLLLGYFEYARKTGQKEPSVLLLAPTGKAAVRVQESISEAKTRAAGDPSFEKMKSVPDKASTVHRALGLTQNVSSYKYTRRKTVLDADIIVVDEASMIDLALMHSLVLAVPEKSRLILLGDPHQLASVEAGSILNDICEAAVKNPDTLGRSLVKLQGSKRFKEEGAVGKLAAAVREGDIGEVERILNVENYVHVSLSPVCEPEALAERLDNLVASGLWDGLLDSDPLKRLECFARFRVLVALRKGHFGSQWINGRLDELVRLRTGSSSTNDWYDGRPVIVEANDYSLGLFNGDVGIYCEQLGQVVFPGEGPNPKTVKSHLLTNINTAYATTVHKSQGAQHENVLLILPPKKSRVLCRELIYTAVTRAQLGVEILSSLAILKESLLETVKRKSAVSALIDDGISREF